MWFSKVRDLGPFKLKVKTDIEKYRADTWQTKEPETIRWIDSFKPGSIFIDVGANIGIYSLYAASQGHGVYAFEPHEGNFNRLRENKRLNGFFNFNTYNMAMGSEAKIVRLNESSNEIGISGAQVGTPTDEHGRKFVPSSVKEIYQTTLNNILENLLFRTIYVKIDVDGHEGHIVAGIGKQGKKISSLLIEVNKNTSKKGITQAMKGWGLEEDVLLNHSKPHSSDRRRGDPVNMIYTRPGGLNRG